MTLCLLIIWIKKTFHKYNLLFVVFLISKSFRFGKPKKNSDKQIWWVCQPLRILSWEFKLVQVYIGLSLFTLWLSRTFMLPSQPFTKLKFMVTKFVLCLKQLASFFLEFYHQPVVIFSQVLIGLSDSINFTSFDGNGSKC